MKSSLVSTTVLLAGASTLLGHGVQIQTTFNPTTGRIETRRVVTSTSSATAAEPIPPGFDPAASIAAPARIFVMPLSYAEIGSGAGFYTRLTDVPRGDIPAPAYPSGPGQTYRYVYQTGAGATGWDWSNSANPPTDPTLPNLAGTNFSFALLDGLKQWNGGGFVDPGAEQLQLFRGDGTTAFTPTTVNTITTDAGPFSALSLATISSTTRPGVTSIPHSSVSFRLLGDGTNASVAGDNGVYLLSLKFTSTAVFGSANTPVGDSDPFYFVMYKGDGSFAAAAQEAAAALSAARGIPASQVQVVPEPASLALILPLLLCRGRRSV